MQCCQDERRQYSLGRLTCRADGTGNLACDHVQIREKNKESEREEDCTGDRFQASRGCLLRHHAGLLKGRFLAPRREEGRLQRSASKIRPEGGIYRRTVAGRGAVAAKNELVQTG